MQCHPKIAHENRRSSEDLSEMPFWNDAQQTQTFPGEDTPPQGHTRHCSAFHLPAVHSGRIWYYSHNPPMQNTYSLKEWGSIRNFEMIVSNMNFQDVASDLHQLRSGAWKYKHIEYLWEPQHTHDHIECEHMQILSQAVPNVENSSKQSHDLSSRQSNCPLHTCCTFQTDTLENETWGPSFQTKGLWLWPRHI